MTDLDDFLEPLDPPLVVVTTIADGERSGCLVGFHCQPSIGPERYAVWISTANHTYPIARRAERLAVHVVGTGDRDLAELFGGETGDEIDKFTRCAWSDGPGGVPLLDRLATRLIGRIETTADVGGDHVLFVLAPERVDAGPAIEPLRASALAGMAPGHEADEG